MIMVSELTTEQKLAIVLNSEEVMNAVTLLYAYFKSESLKTYIKADFNFIGEPDTFEFEFRKKKHSKLKKQTHGTKNYKATNIQG